MTQRSFLWIDHQASSDNLRKAKQFSHNGEPDQFGVAALTCRCFGRCRDFGSSLVNQK
jgi:hypothetical protein